MKVVILAGGGGTRLFPLSRACYPKQFLSIAGEPSLLVQTVNRFLHIVEAKDIIIVTNDDYIFHVKAELDTIQANDAHIIAEPVGRNTAPAIALAVSYCRDRLNCTEEEVVFVGPADHVMKPTEEFCKLVNQNTGIASQGYIVTLGVTPSKPETGYGYIESSDEKIEDAYQVARFIEKPNLEMAEKYIKNKRYFWNSGMFMFSIGTIEKEFASFAPAITEIACQNYDFVIKNFTNMPDISIDYAVAEQSKRIVVVPMKNIYWNDIGSFDAISEMLGNQEGNLFDGDIMADGCKNTMIIGSERFIAGIDLQDLMIIDTPDALLVARKGESQKVKQVVSRLKKANRREAVENLTMYRPWGSYTILSEGKGIQG